MSRQLTRRLFGQSLFQSPTYIITASTRSFSNTISKWEDDKKTPDPPKGSRPQSAILLENLYGTPQPKSGGSPSDAQNPMSALSGSSIFNRSSGSGGSIDTSALTGDPSKTWTPRQTREVAEDEHEPFHLHVFSHKHNTHITCTRPNREPIISLSAGNLGFKKHRRGMFDSGYSLTKYVLDRLVYMGYASKINKLEVVLRGFGQGRDAAVKCLMSPEGQLLRDKIVRVADSTRLKFGGTRSPRKRRL